MNKYLVTIKCNDDIFHIISEAENAREACDNVFFAVIRAEKIYSDIATYEKEEKK